MILRITGGTSILELYEDQIVLRPTVDSDDRPTKTIPLDQVSMIWVSRSFFRTPYLQVVTPDLVRTKKDAYRGTAANVVQIMPGNMPKVDQLQQYLADYKAAHPSAPADHGAKPQASGPTHGPDGRQRDHFAQAEQSRAVTAVKSLGKGHILFGAGSRVHPVKIGQHPIGCHQRTQILYRHKQQDITHRIAE